ncbi:unnamed protein product [Cyprideis torosa]|uniref:BBS7 beta-propeller domain-containing protein n=1 Tax=Cyprideis torosa TaxID=163714 RepID=A0A7R8W685_9CRUS|nr:unnamed protein product [Cyprideis torosa]CAG0886131.1 unnamed protein product [Cyprideis torosa]
MSMDLTLTRVDYCHVGLTSVGCLKIFSGPAEEGNTADRSQQKFVVGDHDGILQVLSIKRGEAVPSFRSLKGNKITAVELGGPLGTVRDKIFIAAGNQVKGFTKKGKQFLGFDTNLTENIQCMAVSGSDLLVSSTFAFNHYRDCLDTNYLVASDHINAMICLPQEKVTPVRPVLACEDRTLKVVAGSDIQYQVELEGSPTALALAWGDGGVQGNEVVYGTAGGIFGADPKHTGTVTSFDFYPLTGGALKDIIIGRDDGTVQVYAFLEPNDPPVIKYNFAGSESITAVAGGVIGTEGYDEILVTTYSADKDYTTLTSAVAAFDGAADVMTRRISPTEFCCRRCLHLLGAADVMPRRISPTELLVLTDMDDFFVNKTTIADKDYTTLTSAVAVVDVSTSWGPQT